MDKKACSSTQMSRPWDSVEYTKSAALQAGVAVDLISRLAIQPTDRILDLGCGIGNLTVQLAEIASRGEVVGVDTSPAMVEQAKRNLQEKALPNIKFLIASASGLPEDTKFDVVFSNSVLHWIKDQDQVLGAIHRLLTSPGRVGLQFPLLAESHPLISVSQEAIQSLGLESKYESWTFPWYVPQSPSSYASLLREMLFSDVSVTQRKTSFVFGSASAAMGFFDAVGIDRFLQPLSSVEAITFREEVHRILADCETGAGIHFNFSRLYAFASA